MFTDSLKVKLIKSLQALRAHFKRSKKLEKEQIFCSIGDVCTRELLKNSVKPRWIVIDGFTGCVAKRNRVKLEVPTEYEVIRVKRYENLSAVNDGKYYCFSCEGEDDNYLQDVLASAPLGAKIRFGLVSIVVTPENKAKARKHRSIKYYLRTGAGNYESECRRRIAAQTQKK